MTRDHSISEKPQSCCSDSIYPGAKVRFPGRPQLSFFLPCFFSLSLGWSWAHTFHVGGGGAASHRSTPQTQTHADGLPQSLVWYQAGHYVIRQDNGGISRTTLSLLAHVVAVLASYVIAEWHLKDTEKALTGGGASWRWVRPIDQLVEKLGPQEFSKAPALADGFTVGRLGRKAWKPPQRFKQTIA